MKETLLVGAGGFVGSALRYQIGVLALHFNFKLPVGTLFVNLVGCLVIGYLGGLAEKRDVLSAEVRLLFVTGLLGGFTTFSAFSFETLALLRRQQFLLAFLYLSISVLGGVILVWLGLKISGILAPKIS